MNDLLIDGAPPSADDLAYLAQVNYGAITSFRVEDGAARGLDLHLARLADSSIEIFGEAVGEDRLRELMRRALADRSDAWLRVSLFSPSIRARQPSGRVTPRVMTVVSPPPPPLARRIRLQVQTYVRDAAHLKHTGTFPLIRARRLAQDAGFDDALFADPDGLISEGASWNIGFISGDRIVWPQAPMLVGVTQALLDAHLADVDLSSETRAIRLDHLGAFDGAFICNSSTPACPVTAIGDRALEVDAAMIDRLTTAWSRAPSASI